MEAEEGQVTDMTPRPAERILREAVYEAVVNAEADGHTEPIATTEYCVQFLLRRFPEMTAAAALNDFKRLRPTD
ncbi:MAG TPA: hypothetical protein VM325_15630 [Alphaproteobacteria bacterium]|nr:hypothetical protein [Alphaproteobacteria bacterium]